MIEYTRMTLEDVDGVLDNLYPSYYSEGNTTYMTPCMDNARKTISQYADLFTILAKDNGVIVGIAVATIGHTFYKEPECDVGMFYVMPQYRGNGVSRKLVELAVEAGKSLGCKLFYSSCLGGVAGKNEQLFINLWAKFGFERLGTVMYMKDTGK